MPQEVDIEPTVHLPRFDALGHGFLDGNVSGVSGVSGVSRACPLGMGHAGPLFRQTDPVGSRSEVGRKCDGQRPLVAEANP